MRLDHSPKADDAARLAFAEIQMYLRGRDPGDMDDEIISHIADVMADARRRDADVRQQENDNENYRLAVERDG